MNTSMKETATADFLDESLIARLLKKGAKASPGDALKIIDKARQAQGLTPEEAVDMIVKGMLG